VQPPSGGFSWEEVGRLVRRYAGYGRGARRIFACFVFAAACRSVAPAKAAWLCCGIPVVAARKGSMQE